MICPFCDGDGFVMADVGQLFECCPCNGTGKTNENTEKEQNNDRN